MQINLNADNLWDTISTTTTFAYTFNVKINGVDVSLSVGDELQISAVGGDIVINNLTKGHRVCVANTGASRLQELERSANPVERMIANALGARE